MQIDIARMARTSAAASVFAALLASSACAGAQARGGRAAMPADLLGTWDIAAVACTGQGNPDSDTRLVITPAGIDNYEQTFVPVKVARVSDTPRAWTIRSRLSFDGQSSDHRALYALDGGGRLTIVDDSRTETYSRCR